MSDSIRDLEERMREHRARSMSQDGWKRHSFVLPMSEARETALSLIRLYPKAEYGTYVQTWKVLPSGDVELIIARRPGQDDDRSRPKEARLARDTEPNDR